MCVCLQQGGTDMSQLKKLAQGFQSQDGAGQLGDIDEDDEVPGKVIERVVEWVMSGCG
jgi:hypothetical protein